MKHVRMQKNLRIRKNKKDKIIFQIYLNRATMFLSNARKYIINPLNTTPNIPPLIIDARPFNIPRTENTMNTILAQFL